MEDDHAAAPLSPKMSGRSSWREIPVRRSTCSTRSGGTRLRCFHMPMFAAGMPRASAAFEGLPKCSITLSTGEEAGFFMSPFHNTALEECKPKCVNFSNEMLCI